MKKTLLFSLLIIAVIAFAASCGNQSTQNTENETTDDIGEIIDTAPVSPYGDIIEKYTETLKLRINGQTDNEPI